MVQPAQWIIGIGCGDLLLRTAISVLSMCMSVCTDYQKLEREARICRMLKHPTIGRCGHFSYCSVASALVYVNCVLVLLSVSLCSSF